jgi:hypothetical protein
LLVLLQVDPRLTAGSWKPDPYWADTQDKPIYIFRGDDGEGGKLSTFHWDSSGRIRFDRQDGDPAVWMGYRLLTIGSSADLERLDRDFTDLALAFAAAPGPRGLTFAAGAGTANDGLFADGSTWYGVGHLEQTFDDAHVGISYDGNRSLWRGIPLPYASWTWSPDPTLRLTLGTLSSSLRWTALDGITVNARWDFPGNGMLRIERELGAGFSLFAEGGRRTDGFHERDRDLSRLFYTLNTAEVGIRWRASWLDLSLSGGWAFGQRWSEGTGLDNLERVAAPEDRPFVALFIQGTF